MPSLLDKKIYIAKQDELQAKWAKAVQHLREARQLINGSKNIELKLIIYKNGKVKLKHSGLVSTVA